jgi:hypothetical protein
MGDNIAGVIGAGTMGTAAITGEAKSAILPGKFDKPEVHKVLLVMLGEMDRYKSAFRGVGYSVLSKQVKEFFPGTSEYYIKKLLQMIRDFGYGEAGRTKQGTAITAKGQELLLRLREKYDG